MRLNENVQVPTEVGGILRSWLQENMQGIGRRVNANNRPSVQLSCSDLLTALSAATSVAYFRPHRACLISGVRACLLTESSSGAVTIDINVNGTTILSTKLTIDQGEKTSVTAATPCVVTLAALKDDDEVTIDIDGAGTGAKGLIVTVIVEY